MIEQGTDAWKQLRAGKVTASRIADLTAKGKSGQPSRSRANYEAQLICERLTGVIADSYQSREMERGNEVEDQARATYSFVRNIEVRPASFVDHPTIEMAGASPDSYAAEDGLAEFKCPNTATHLDALLGKNVPGNYLKQIYWQLACTGKAWCDYVSFDDRVPEHLQLHVVRVERDEKVIAELETEVRKFLDGITEKMKRLEELAA